MIETFIRTTDSETAEKLRALGYTEIQQTGNGYVFLNDTVKFSRDVDKSKIVFTNVYNA